jgi:hypothetical protein
VQHHEMTTPDATASVATGVVMVATPTTDGVPR